MYTAVHIPTLVLLVMVYIGGALQGMSQVGRWDYLHIYRGVGQAVVALVADTVYMAACCYLLYILLLLSLA